MFSELDRPFNRIGRWTGPVIESKKLLLHGSLVGPVVE